VNIQAIIRIQVDEGVPVKTDEFTAVGCTVTSNSERDPFVSSFLVAFAAGSTIEFVKALKVVARRHRGFSVSLRAQSRRLTLETNDPDLSEEVLTQLIGNFIKPRQHERLNESPARDNEV